MTILILMALSLITTLSTFTILKLKKMSAIRASAFITVIMIFILRGINYLYNIESHLGDIEPLVFTASFLGMSSIEKYTTKDMCVIALALAIFFVLIRPHDHGIGGSLGASAFICCTVYFYLKRIFTDFSLGK